MGCCRHGGKIGKLRGHEDGGWVFLAVTIWLYFNKKGHCKRPSGIPTNLLLGRQFMTSSGKNGVVNERDSQIILVVSKDF